jgi:hypothetical protein
MNNLLAQTTISIAPSTTEGGISSLTSINISNIISGAIGLILIAAALLFFIMLVIGGIKWILSGGDKAQTESARNQVTAALVGLVIVFAAWAIATFVGQLFGIQLFGGTGIQLPTFTAQ